MPPTDHPLKRLITMAAADVAVWLLAQPVRRVTTRPAELTLAADPIDADLVFIVELVDGREVILHLEFQGPGSKRPLRLRLLEYLARLALTYRDIPIVSVVIYLGGAGATDKGSHSHAGLDDEPCLQWHYRVVRLWQIPGEELLALGRPALLPLLGQMALANPQAVMTQAVQKIGTQTTGEQRTLLLSELLLLCQDAEVAQMVEHLIQQSYGDLDTPMMRKLRAEGREEGREAGRAEGEEVGQEELVLRLLGRRYGTLDVLTLSQVQQLTREQRLQLVEALFDFHQLDDLRQWLARLGPES